MDNTKQTMNVLRIVDLLQVIGRIVGEMNLPLGVKCAFLKSAPYFMRRLNVSDPYGEITSRVRGFAYKAMALAYLRYKRGPEAPRERVIRAIGRIGYELAYREAEKYGGQVVSDMIDGWNKRHQTEWLDFQEVFCKHYSAGVIEGQAALNALIDNCRGLDDED